MARFVGCSRAGSGLLFWVLTWILAAEATAGVVRPIKLQTFEGRPYVNLRELGIGSTHLQYLPEIDARLEAFHRLAELIVLSQRPDLLPVKVDPRDQRTLRHRQLVYQALAHDQLTIEARVPYFLPGVNPLRGNTWRGADEFERERSVERFESEMISKIQAAAAKVKLPMKLVFATEGSLREYDFPTGGFRVYLSNGLAQTLHVLAGKGSSALPKLGYSSLFFPGYKMGDQAIPVWKLGKDQAHALLPRLGKERTVMVVWEVTLVDMADKGGQSREYGSGTIRGRVDALKLYLPNKAMPGELIHTYPRDSYFDAAEFARLDRLREEKSRRAALERVEFPDATYLVAAYAHFSAEGEAAVERIVKRQAEQVIGDPFQRKAFVTEQRPKLIQRYKDFDAARKFWISGRLSLGHYDIEREIFPFYGTPRPMFISTASGTHYDKQVGAAFLDVQFRELKMPSEKAQKLVRSHPSGSSSYAVKIAYRALVSPYDLQSDERDRGRLGHIRFRVHKLELLADMPQVALQQAHILDPRKVLFTYVPDDPATLEARRKAMQDEQGREIAQMARSCEASGSPGCWGELCKKIQSMNDPQRLQWCMGKRKAAMQAAAATLKRQQEAAWQDEVARQAATARVAAAQAESDSRRSACKDRFSGRNAFPWYPAADSPALEQAVDRCLTEAPRRAQGPDIVGLRLGMTENDTRVLIQRLKLTRSSESDDPRPYHAARWQWSRDDSQGIALFFHYNGGERRVAAISRRLYFADKGPGLDKVRAGLQKKYGKPTWNGPGKDGAMLWAFGDKAMTSRCSSLEGRLKVRDGWRREWEVRPRGMAAVSMGGAGVQNVQQACMDEAGLSQMGPGMDPDRMMQVQQCMQQRLQAAMGQAGAGGQEQRRPLMIGAEGGAAEWAKFKGCGPVIVARFGARRDGALNDLSVVLFQPAWLAEQPDFMFSEGDGAIQF